MLVKENDNDNKLSKSTSIIITILSFLIGFWIAKQLMIYREEKRTGIKQPMDKVDEIIWGLIAAFFVILIVSSVIAGIIYIFDKI